MQFENKSPSVVVIVLNWNGKNNTLECIDSLCHLNYANFRIVLVDNGSTDGTVDEVHLLFPNVITLQTGENLGYAGGNNVGIVWALNNAFDYILLLNNDTIVDSELLTAFAHTARRLDRNNCVLGAKIYYFDRPKKIWFFGGRWKISISDFEHIGIEQDDGPDFASEIQCDYITGCALFASSNIFRSVGLLDENFFLYYEEADWCYRAKAQGSTCFVNPNAKLWHKVSSSFGGSNSPLITYFASRNRLLWVSKHCSRVVRRKIERDAWLQAFRTVAHKFYWPDKKLPFFRGFAWSMSSWFRGSIRRFRQPESIALLYGLRDYYLKRFGNCPTRVRELKQLT